MAPPKKKDDKKVEEEEPPFEDSGVFVYENGDRYEGQFQRKEGVVRRHGEGVWTEGDTTYQGHWQDDRRWGQGTLTFSSGAWYHGQFIEDRFEGFGVYQWPSGARYEGEWRANTMHGEGVYHEAPATIEAVVAQESKGRPSDGRVGGTGEKETASELEATVTGSTAIPRGRCWVGRYYNGYGPGLREFTPSLR